MRSLHRALAAAVILGILGVPSAALAATSALPTLLPTADGTRDATVQVRGVTLAFDAIDEGLGAADTTSYLQNQQGFAGRYFALVTDMPADFTSMGSLSISIRARTVGVTDDQTSLFAQAFAADETTALSGEVLVGTNPGPGGWIDGLQRRPARSDARLESHLGRCPVAPPLGVHPGGLGRLDPAAAHRRRAARHVQHGRRSTTRHDPAEPDGRGCQRDEPDPELQRSPRRGLRSGSGRLRGPGSRQPAHGQHGRDRRLDRDPDPRFCGHQRPGRVRLYAVPATNPVQDVAGNDAAAFSGQAVTNNTPPPGDTDPPAPDQRSREWRDAHPRLR